MTTKDEALKLALEALSASDDFLFNYHDCEPNNEREVDAYSEIRANNMAAWEAVREALAEQPAQQQEPVANELKLHIIRKWPEGFQDRLQHVWLDVVSFIPDVKLYDLQRVLAEFGFTMKVYEGDPPASKPLTDEEIWDEVKAADLDWQTGWSLDEDASNRYITFARAIEAAHGIKEKRND